MQDDYQKVIDRRLRHIRSDDEIAETERQRLLDYHEALEQHNRESSAKHQISGTRHESYLSHLHRLAKHTDALVGTLDPDVGEDAVDEIVRWVDGEYDNGYTLDNYYSALRSWGRFLAPDAPDEDYPERFAKVELGNVEDDQPAPEPSEVLFWNDVVEIIEHCNHEREKAMTALLWALGCRPMSEFWELTFGQIDDRGDHLLVSIESDSKTFARTVRVDVGAPYVRLWMEEAHPANATERGPRSDTYLWTKRYEDEHVGYQDIRRNIKRAAERAGLTKPANPEHFRKSRASILAASRYVSQRDLEFHFGWSRGSRVVAHYIAVFGTESRKHIAMADGAQIDYDEESEPIVPVVCDHCGRQTPRHCDECLWCPGETIAELGQAPRLVEPTVADEGADLLDLIVDGDVDADDLRALDRLQPIIQRRDDLWDRLPSYIEHAEQLAD